MSSRRRENMIKDVRTARGAFTPLSQWDRSNGRSPRPVGMGLMEHVIKPDFLNVADNEAD